MSEDLIQKEAEIYKQCLAEAHKIAGQSVAGMKEDFRKSLTADGLMSFEHAIASTLYIERNRRTYGGRGGKGGAPKGPKFTELPADKIISTPLPFGKWKEKTLKELAAAGGEQAEYLEYILDKWEDLGKEQRDAIAGLLKAAPVTTPAGGGDDQNPFSTKDDLPF